MSNHKNDFQKTKTEFDTGSGKAHLYSLKKLEEMGYDNISRLPFSIKILLEAVLREHDGFAITDKDIELLANYNASDPEGEIPFKPSRVVLQDFTGVPAVVDLAALDRKSTRLNSSHVAISYAVFCLKKKMNVSR